MSTFLFGDVQRRCRAAEAIVQRIRATAHNLGLCLCRLQWNDSVGASDSRLYWLELDTDRETAKIYFTERELTCYDEVCTRQEVDRRLDNLLIDLCDCPRQALVTFLSETVKNLRQ